MNRFARPNGRDRLGCRMGMLLVTLALLVCVSPAAAQQEPVPGSPGEQTKLFGYDDGFFLRTADRRFQLKTNGLLQVRFQADFSEEGQSESRFSVPRARLDFNGHAFSRKFRYRVLPEFGSGGVRLLSYYLDMILIRKAFHLWVGQGKKPFGRQFLTGAKKWEFGVRSITSLAFGAERDIGVMLHNDYKKAQGFEWALGIYNGTGIDSQLLPEFDEADELVGVTSTNIPDDFRPELVLRLGYNTGGIDGYSEADLTGEAFRWAVGVGARSRFDAPHDGFSDSAFALDFILKVRGWAFVTGNFVLLDSPLGSDGLADQQYRQWGTYNQLSYTLNGKNGLAIRWAMIDPEGGGNDTHEVLIGYNLFAIDHRFKWHLNGGALFFNVGSEGDENFVSSLIRTQLQFAF